MEDGVAQARKGRSGRSVTRLNRVGIALKVAGHSSTALTGRMYTHLQPDDLRSTSDAMERAFAG
jgi:hypothetical protein